MKTVLLERKVINCPPMQEKMVKSGWGAEVIEKSIVEKIKYRSDGLTIKGYAAYPKNINKKIPVIFWNRGGYKNNGAIDLFTARGMFGKTASWGYFVFASSYRGSRGSEGEDEVGGKDVNDILNLIHAVKEYQFADENNMGIEGWSRGGLMTLLTLMKTDKFKCAVLNGAISNIEDFFHRSSSIKKYLENLTEDKDISSVLKKRNILSRIEKLPDIPYLIIHGENDTTVPPEHSIELSRKFSEINYTSKLAIIKGGDHFLKKNREETDKLRKNWFDKYLK
jgi:dipeptidyl aminopeptidase/acylaminoacyl peptidase